MGVVFHLFPTFAVVLYLAATAAFVRVLLPGAKNKLTTGRALLLVGVTLHALSLVLQESVPPGTAEADYVTTFPYTLSLISCLAVALFLVLERRLQISVLGAVIAPLASFFMLASGVLFHVEGAAETAVPFDVILWVHIALTVAGHAAFVLAFAVSVILIVQESMLKNKRISSLQRKLPSLKLLDTLNGRLLAAGFVFMVCGVLAGFLFGFIHELRFIGFNSRVLWSFLTLLIYALLLSARIYRGFRGRRAAWLSVAGFCTVLASFLSGSLLGEQFHGF